MYYRSNSVQFGSFKLSAHKDDPDLPLSPYYLHYPKSPEESGFGILPKLFELIGREFFEICESQDIPIRPKRIAGVPTGALPLADEHAKHYSEYPENLILFTKLEKPGNTVFQGPEGEFTYGDELIIDEDHTSGGRNKKLIRATAMSAGLVVPYMLTAIDRQQGGVENMARDGVKLLSILTIKELFQFGAEYGHITEQQFNEALTYRTLVNE